MIVVSGMLRYHADRVADALESFQENAAATRREPGCAAYGLYADPDDPLLFRVFEEWADEESAAAHRQAPHFVAHQQRTAGAVASGELTRYTVEGAQRFVI